MEKRRFKILVIDAMETMRSRLQTLLSTKGFEVHCFDTSAAGLSALENPESSPFSLIISSYTLPKMKGDDLLLKAREISPSTLRILMVDAAYVDIMISAVNTAQIHSCLTLPFEDNDLMVTVENCCLQYEATLKLENLQKIIQRQNRQLFQIASNFKKQEILDLAQMEDRKKQIRILESKFIAGKKAANPHKIPSLKEIIETEGIDLSPRGLGAQFVKMKDQVKLILETAAFRHSIELNPLYYRDVLYRSGQEKSFSDLTAFLMPSILMLLQQSNAAGMNLFGKDFQRYLDKHLQIKLSRDRAMAFLQIKKMEPRILDLTIIKYYLFWHNITYGVKEDIAIKEWLLSASPESDPFVIAQGRPPVFSEDAAIQYHFPTDFRHAGTVNEDGSINFRDRGEIPFVHKNTFLAAKSPSQKGRPGIDVTGQEIPVSEPIDRAFEAGPGTRISEDGNKIYAEIEGQPHLDPMGRVTICQELVLHGDLGFETGDVIFDGNVVVEGV